jgi:hypothetical protein
MKLEAELSFDSEKQIKVDVLEVCFLAGVVVPDSLHLLFV